MKRDWIAEIRQFKTVKDISKETGIPQKRLREYYTGKRKFDSTIKDYEKIRNLNRKLAYQQFRESGASPKIALKHRRTFFNPYRESEKINVIKHVREDNMPAGEVKYQYRILGNFINRKTKEIRYGVEGFSWALPVRDYERQIKEAINSALGKLGGTNWELLEILEENWITYQGGKPVPVYD